ncbi:MAG: hypothetical protein F6K42_26855 [Leptolyngbya sp. SIO1D8]|nr:hypothetical protein [Leptolyngbya sp. SIO1D8]
MVLQQSLANATDRESVRSMATSVLETEGQAAMTNLIGANILEALDEGNRAKPWVRDGGGAAGGAGGGKCVFAGFAAIA